MNTRDSNSATVAVEFSSKIFSSVSDSNFFENFSLIPSISVLRLNSRKSRNSSACVSTIPFWASSRFVNSAIWDSNFWISFSKFDIEVVFSASKVLAVSSFSVNSELVFVNSSTLASNSSIFFFKGFSAGVKVSSNSSLESNLISTLSSTTENSAIYFLPSSKSAKITFSLVWSTYSNFEVSFSSFVKTFLTNSEDSSSESCRCVNNNSLLSFCLDTFLPPSLLLNCKSFIISANCCFKLLSCLLYIIIEADSKQGSTSPEKSSPLATPRIQSAVNIKLLILKTVSPSISSNWPSVTSISIDWL